jgi:hypothetical protein
MKGEDVVVLPGPGEGLCERPTAGSLAVEAELRRQSVEAVSDILFGTAQLISANQGRQSELTLAQERLWIDGEPRLSFGPKNVVGVKVLIDEHGFALRWYELAQRFKSGFKQLLLKGSPSSFPLLGEVGRPPLGFGRERTKGRTSGYP